MAVPQDGRTAPTYGAIRRGLCGAQKSDDRNGRRPCRSQLGDQSDSWNLCFNLSNRWSMHGRQRPQLCRHRRSAPPPVRSKIVPGLSNHQRRLQSAICRQFCRRSQQFSASSKLGARHNGLNNHGFRIRWLSGMLLATVFRAGVAADGRGMSIGRKKRSGVDLVAERSALDADGAREMNNFSA